MGEKSQLCRARNRAVLAKGPVWLEEMRPEREREPEPDLWVLQAWEGTGLSLGKPLEGYKQKGM